MQRMTFRIREWLHEGREYFMTGDYASSDSLAQTLRICDKAAQDLTAAVVSLSYSPSNPCDAS